MLSGAIRALQSKYNKYHFLFCLHCMQALLQKQHAHKPAEGCCKGSWAARSCAPARRTNTVAQPCGSIGEACQVLGNTACVGHSLCTLLMFYNGALPLHFTCHHFCFVHVFIFVSPDSLHAGLGNSFCFTALVVRAQMTWQATLLTTSCSLPPMHCCPCCASCWASACSARSGTCRTTS